MRFASTTKTALFSMTTSTMSYTSTNKGAAPIVSMHWFRKGLRLSDNPALSQSLDYLSSTSEKNNLNRFYAVYILDGDTYQLRNTSPLRAQFLCDALQDLDQNLQSLGSRLYVATGNPTEVLPQLWSQWNVTHVTCEADETGEPYATKRDSDVLQLAKHHDINFHAIPTETLFSMNTYMELVGNNTQKVPGTMSAFQSLIGVAQRKNSNNITLPVETPISTQFPKTQNHDEYKNEMNPPKVPTDLPWPRDISKDELNLIWNKSDCKNLTPLVKGGETAAFNQLTSTIGSNPAWVASFQKPKTSCTSIEKPSTTGLSPYLSLGCVSPRTVWYAVSDAIGSAPASTPKSKPPVSLHGQLLWREFNNLIAHTANRECPGSWEQMENNKYCREVPWSNDPELLQAWKEGRTGYPWIDACMVQLKTQGWIHHLGRHAVACFLTRGDLWQSWEEGAAHFESQLLDADYALNSFNWLWLSCSGFFYQYFRCYGPVSFQKKNDKSGQYIRKWLPQLKKLPDKYIYEPWKAPIAVQKASGVIIGKDYPKPIVDHAYVSKENMGKMSLAYDIHKEKLNAEKKSKKKKMISSKAAPSRKRVKK